ncbi:MAG: hypothetical protein AMJ53_12985 [Gammaproteobacteria bacterium SG8_11]|nr:MAG: hypothetical protein AMJ53_12985 [Gammaproteobacteria bacterium SG8_11]
MAATGYYCRELASNEIFKPMEQQLDIQTADAMELQLPIAGVGGRSYAFLIDWHIRFLFVLLWFIAIPLLFGQLLKMDEFFNEVFESAWWFILMVIGPPVVVYLFYHPVLELVMKGRTPGKRMAGVRIVTLEGHTPSVGAIIIRNVFRIVDSLPSGYVLGLIVAMSTKNAVRIGDIAAGTLLIYEDKVQKSLLQNLQNMATKPHIDARQWEIANELLSRWRSLERPKRTQLALQLFQNLGESVPQDQNERELDIRLRQQLKRIVKG